ncbi:MAG: sulfatase-like hydrolase/transferase [Candidatus Lokiarchaeota archaeon]|nr:sulfatase-like hydrolase/transferase [Candidatus Lokiarchaeota archaeon]
MNDYNKNTVTKLSIEKNLLKMNNSKRCILITIDCWRLDRLQIFGNEMKVMPNMNNLCKKSIIFKNMIANSSNTAPSFYALFNSKIPVIDGDYTPLPINEDSLPKMLMKHDIKTCGIHSNPHLGRLTHYDYGFNEFFDLFEKQNKKSFKKILIGIIYNLFKILKVENLFVSIKSLIIERIRRLLRMYKNSNNQIKSPYANAKIITSKAINWLTNNYENPFFLWIHFMDAHSPYFPPNEFIGNITDTFISEKKKKFLHEWGNNFRPFMKLSKNHNEIYKKLIKSLYDAELNYIDHYIGIFISFLKKIKIFEDCNLIITADHGEALFEHGNLGHQICLYDELLRVPLIMKLPKIHSKFNKQLKFNDLVESIDIAPTILDFFSIPENKTYRGISFLPLVNGEYFDKKKYVFSALLHNKNKVYSAIRKKDIPYYIMISCRTENWKLIYDEQFNQYEFYNLLEDPNELINLYDKNVSELNFIKRLMLKKLREKMEIYNSETNKISRIISLHKINGRI